MDALILSIALAAMPVMTPAPVDAVTRWQPIIAEASQRFGLPEAWIARVMRAESGGQTRINGQPIRSRVGAIGLMQLMPATWAAMRDANGLGADPDDPHDNILAGTAYLRAMVDRFGTPGAFAAYNAGPARYATVLATGGRLPDETLAYLATVTGLPAAMPVECARVGSVGRSGGAGRGRRSADPPALVILWPRNLRRRLSSGQATTRQLRSEAAR